MVTESSLTPETTRPRGFTVEDLAARFRVSPDKIRGWIKRGILRAINTADVACAKPRFVSTLEMVSEFEQSRSVSKPVKPVRRKRKTEAIDFFPD